MAKRTKVKRVKRKSQTVERPTHDQVSQVQDLMKLAMGSAYTRRMLVETSIKFFMWYYYATTMGDHQVRWAHSLLKRKRGLVLGPCGHGKTETFSKGLCSWLIVRNRNIRVLLVSKSDGLAVKNLKVIRHELQNNPRIIGDFGRFYDPEATWSDHQLYCLRTKNIKDPTLEAVGLLGAITGGRFDVIILDDVLDVLNTRSEDQRLKVADYIDGTLLPRLEPWGVCWAIGTRKHADDYYNAIINNKTWHVVHDRAIIREPEKYRIEETDDPVEIETPEGERIEVNARAIIESQDRGEVLWPAKWTMEQLLLYRYGLTTIVFNREYQNICSSDETALFKLRDLEQCRDATVSYVPGRFSDEFQRREFSCIFQGIDPALVDDKKKAEKRDTDFTVIETWGLRKKDKMKVLLGVVRERGLSPAAVERLIESEYKRFDPDFSVIETNAFGLIHASNLIERKGLKLIRHHTDRRKHDVYAGVPGLAVEFENAKIVLPYKTAEDKEKTNKLINEFHLLGAGSHDDTVMAAWFAFEGLRRYLRGEARMRRNIERVNVERI